MARRRPVRFAFLAIVLVGALFVIVNRKPFRELLDSDWANRQRERRKLAALQSAPVQPLLTDEPQVGLRHAQTPTTIMLVSYPRMWPTNFYLVGLRQAGFQVTVVGHAADPPGAMAAQSSSVSCFHGCGRHLNTSCLADAIVACRPALLVSLSDQGTETMINLQSALLYTSHSKRMKQYILALLYRSLPLPHYQRMVLDKDQIINELAHRHLGIRVPPRQQLNMEQLVALYMGKASAPTLPFVIKASRGVAGQGVRVVRSKAAIKTSLQRLIQAIRGENGKQLDGRAGEGDVSIHIEKYFEGQAAMLNAACLNGRVLAAFSLWKNATDSKTGPSMVNSILHRYEMLEAAVKLVAELRFTGFLGLEFMIEGEQAYLMDFNPRINTGSVHPLSRYGLLPLDVLEAMYVGLVDPQDPRLGLHVPSNFDPLRNVFVKFDYRKFDKVHMVASRGGPRGYVQLANSHFSHAPWCDDGLKRYITQHMHIEFLPNLCLVRLNGTHVEGGIKPPEPGLMPLAAPSPSDEADADHRVKPLGEHKNGNSELLVQGKSDAGRHPPDGKASHDKRENQESKDDDNQDSKNDSHDGDDDVSEGDDDDGGNTQNDADKAAVDTDDQDDDDDGDDGPAFQLDVAEAKHQRRRLLKLSKRPEALVLVDPGCGWCWNHLSKHQGDLSHLKDRTYKVKE
eukprot:TRINITY_DN9959_c0_g1_i1.p1 TRINITY_DN9959_c0_g1~~TRINITY_DN9959_c0_g1_i1.p1  ORF type:complete len:680 (+),score=146.60 TRINITY_DN9959_c0_g1_i1:1232-3271(+)